MCEARRCGRSSPHRACPQSSEVQFIPLASHRPGFRKGMWDVQINFPQTISNKYKLRLCGLNPNELGCWEAVLFQHTDLLAP